MKTFRLGLTASLVAACMLTSVTAMADDGAAPKAHCKTSMLSKVKSYLLAKDASGSTRLGKIVVTTAGVGVMSVATATVASVGTALVLVPACASNTASCRENAFRAVTTSPTTAFLGNNGPGAPGTGAN